MKTQIKFYAASLLRPEFLLQLGKMMEEFLTCCVTPQQLLTAAGQMTGQQAQKLSELGLLQAAKSRPKRMSWRRGSGL